MVPRPTVRPRAASLATRSATSAYTASATGAPGIRIALNVLLQWGLAPRSAPSVLELPLSRHDHGDAVLVSGGCHVVVTERTARLDHGADPGGRHGVEPVAKREERIAGRRPALGPSRRAGGGDL